MRVAKKGFQIIGYFFITTAFLFTVSHYARGESYSIERKPGSRALSYHSKQQDLVERDIKKYFSPFMKEVSIRYERSNKNSNQNQCNEWLAEKEKVLIQSGHSIWAKEQTRNNQTQLECRIAYYSNGQKKQFENQNLATVYGSLHNLNVPFIDDETQIRLSLKKTTISPYFEITPVATTMRLGGATGLLTLEGNERISMGEKVTMIRQEISGEKNKMGIMVKMNWKFDPEKIIKKENEHDGIEENKIGPLNSGIKKAIATVFIPYESTESVQVDWGFYEGSFLVN